MRKRLAPHLDRYLSHLIRGRAGWTSHALLFPAVGWLFFFLACPLFLIFTMSFLQRGAYGALIWTFTKGNYHRVLAPGYFPVLLRSFIYAGSTTAFCFLLGYPVAYYLSVYARRRRAAFLMLLMVPFWTSSLVAIYSWMILFGREGLINTLLVGWGLSKEPISFLNTPFAVILGLTYFYLPLMILPLYSCLEKIPKSYIEASKDLGAGNWMTFVKVTLPLSMPGIWAGSILTFVPCVGDFLTAEFLGGPNTYLIGNLIQNQFLATQDWPFGAALTMVLIMIFLVGLSVYSWVNQTGAGLEAAA